ncbi:hypothetical protein [uncultured Nonlabens sp.]|uniref:hypothetical protein n=1 Tax=uncultured Nonlabens sp. TaxID=859306 RepID=UPI0030D8A8B5
MSISKNVFDVPGSVTGQHQYKNDAFGFLAFAKAISKKSFFRFFCKLPDAHLFCFCGNEKYIIGIYEDSAVVVLK